MERTPLMQRTEDKPRTPVATTVATRTELSITVGSARAATARCTQDKATVEHTALRHTTLRTQRQAHPTATVEAAAMADIPHTPPTPNTELDTAADTATDHERQPRYRTP